jgi:dynein heavy chain
VLGRAHQAEDVNPLSKLPPVSPLRRNFDKWFKQTFTSVKMPGKGTVYDYFVNPKTGKFQPWGELVTDISYDSSTPMSTVFVPTAETSSLRFFLDMMVDLRKPIMFVGTAGVGGRPSTS